MTSAPAFFENREAATRRAVEPSTDRSVRWLASLYAIATFAWYCVWKYFMAERSGDEPLFENCLWNAAHGNGLRTSLEGGRHHLAVHFSPVLYLFVPLYRLLPTMHVVHLVVSLATSLAGFVMYRHARRTLESRTATILMVAFLLHPTIVLQTFMEFHEQALAPLPLLLLVVAIARGSLAFAALWSIALLSLREDNVLTVLALSAIAWFVDGRWRMTALLAGIGLGWLFLYWQVSVVALGGGTMPGVFANTYGLWGDSPGSMLRALLQRPLDVVRHLVSPAPIKYLFQLAAPVLVFVPFANPLALAAVPALFMNLLATPGTRPLEVRMHFSVVPITLMYVAMVGVLTRLRERRFVVGPRGRSVRADTLLVYAMLTLSIATMPLWLSRSVERLNPFTAEARAMLATIPDTVSVTAPSYLLNQLARRPALAFAVNDSITATDYVILEDASRRFYRGISGEILYSDRLANVLLDAGYERVYAADGWYVWRRRPAS